MAAKPHGTRVLGQEHNHVMLAGSALAKNDLVQTTEATGSNTVDNAATNVAVFGFTRETIASAATGTVDRMFAGDRFWVKVSAGTVAATTLGKYADIVDELSITLTASNNDCRIMGWDGAVTDFAIVEFGTAESSTTTILA
jgi:hypothetical protein